MTSVGLAERIWHGDCIICRRCSEAAVFRCNSPRRFAPFGKPMLADERKGLKMLHYALVFFVVAIIAAIFGFAGVAAGAAEIAKILFFIFLVLFIVSLVAGLFRRGG